MHGAPRGIAAVVLAAVLVGGGVAIARATSHPETVTVCVTEKGLVRAASAHNRCPKHTHRVVVGMRGPKGETGAQGPAGEAGPKGATGAAGRDAPASGYRKLVVQGDHYDIPGTPFRVECEQSGDTIRVSSYVFQEFTALDAVDDATAAGWNIVVAENGSGGLQSTTSVTATKAFSMHALVPSSLAEDAPVTSVDLGVVYYRHDSACQIDAQVTISK